jgi:hypothetical protein
LSPFKLTDGRGGKGGGGEVAKGNDSEKAWSSINNSILSDSKVFIFNTHTFLKLILKLKIYYVAFQLPYACAIFLIFTKSVYRL